jgi:hypothetical protein
MSGLSTAIYLREGLMEGSSLGSDVDGMDSIAACKAESFFDSTPIDLATAQAAFFRELFKCVDGNARFLPAVRSRIAS